MYSRRPEMRAAVSTRVRLAVVHCRPVTVPMPRAFRSAATARTASPARTRRAFADDGGLVLDDGHLVGGVAVAAHPGAGSLCLVRLLGGRRGAGVRLCARIRAARPPRACGRPGGRWGWRGSISPVAVASWIPAWSCRSITSSSSRGVRVSRSTCQHTITSIRPARMSAFSRSHCARRLPEYADTSLSAYTPATPHPLRQLARSRMRSIRCTRSAWVGAIGVTLSVVTPASCSAASRSRI